MNWKAIGLTVVGAAGVIGGILYIVGEELPGWVPALDDEIRLVAGLGVAFGGFVLVALGALSLMAGAHSMGARLERRPFNWGRLVLVVGTVAVGVAGGLIAWISPVPKWMRWVAWLDDGERLGLGGGLMAVAVIGLVLCASPRKPRRVDPPYPD